MADTNYSEALATGGPGEAGPEVQQNEEGGEDTALLPRDIFPDDVEVGDEVRLKVVHLYDDEVEVEPVGDEEKTKNEAEANSEGETMKALAARGRPSTM